MQLHIENISSINVLYILCLQVCEFTEQLGPQLEGLVDRSTGTPLDYFFMLFPVTQLQMLVAHTNSYATFCMAGDGPDAVWVDMTEGEMRAFLGINILMGIVHMPTTAMYWSSHVFFGNRRIQMVMTYNRFFTATQGISRVRSTVQGPPSDGYSTCHISEVLRIIPWCGSGWGHDRIYRTLVISTIRACKPIKRGINCWMLCDSRSGYLSNFEVYLSRNTANRDQGLAYNVVMSSEAIRLSRGTVSTNRKGFPAELKKPPWPTPTWPDAGALEGKGSKRPSTRKAHTKKANPKKAHFERVPKSPTFSYQTGPFIDILPESCSSVHDTLSETIIEDQGWRTPS